MKKKQLETVVISKEFLSDLLAPFFPMQKIEKVEFLNNRIKIFYRKEVTEHTP